MITFDADIQFAETESLQFLPDQSIKVNESVYQIENVEIAAISNPPTQELLNSEIFTNEHTVKSTIQIKEWTTSLEKEFQKLAEKEALDEATEDEMHRLEELSPLRSRFRSKMSAEQIFFLHNLQKKQDHLLKELNEYVRFIKTSHY